MFEPTTFKRLMEVVEPTLAEEIQSVARRDVLSTGEVFVFECGPGTAWALLEASKTVPALRSAVVDIRAAFNNAGFDVT